MRHILGNNTTRRGVFDFFDLFQHKPLNKRLIYILIENLLNNFFMNSINSSTSTVFHYSFYSLTQLQQENGNVNTNSVLACANPLTKLIRIHLSKSSRVKSINKHQQNQQQLKSEQDNRTAALVSSQLTGLSPTTSITSILSMNSITLTIPSDLPRSKSLHSEINC